VRLLGILWQLLRGDRPSVHDFARQFHTRRESIYRDLRALQDARIPIKGDENGQLTHPRLEVASRLEMWVPRLTRHEITALTWALREGERRQPFRQGLATGLQKISMMADPADSRRASRLEEVLGGRERGTKDYVAADATLIRLIEAITGHRRCRVEYRSPQRSAPRRFPFDPYRVVSVHGGLYCLGKVPAYANVATLAIERIVTLTVTEEPFTVDPALRLDRYEAEAFGVAWERPMTVVARFRADQAPYVRERQWHPTQRVRELAGGRVELTFRAGGMFEIMRWVLGWGDAAEVARPAALRAEVAAALGRAHAAYRRTVRATTRRSAG
jgi:predicted DNA-binding transcriptional regulator YafY